MTDLLFLQRTSLTVHVEAIKYCTIQFGSWNPDCTLMKKGNTQQVTLMSCDVFTPNLQNSAVTAAVFWVKTQAALLGPTVHSCKAKYYTAHSDIHKKKCTTTTMVTVSIIKNLFVYILTNPEIVQALAYGAVLLWDLVEVLVKAWLQGNETGERWKIVFWGCKTDIMGQPWYHSSSLFFTLRKWHSTTFGWKT